MIPKMKLKHKEQKINTKQINPKPPILDTKIMNPIGRIRHRKKLELETRLKPVRQSQRRRKRTQKALEQDYCSEQDVGSTSALYESKNTTSSSKQNNQKSIEEKTCHKYGNIFNKIIKWQAEGNARKTLRTRSDHRRITAQPADKRRASGLHSPMAITEMKCWADKRRNEGRSGREWEVEGGFHIYIDVDGDGDEEVTSDTTDGDSSRTSRGEVSGVDRQGARPGRVTRLSSCGDVRAKQDCHKTRGDVCVKKVGPNTLTDVSKKKDDPSVRQNTSNKANSAAIHRGVSNKGDCPTIDQKPSNKDICASAYRDVTIEGDCFATLGDGLVKTEISDTSTDDAVKLDNQTSHKDIIVKKQCPTTLCDASNSDAPAIGDVIERASNSKGADKETKPKKSHQLKNVTTGELKSTKIELNTSYPLLSQKLNASSQYRCDPGWSASSSGLEMECIDDPLTIYQIQSQCQIDTKHERSRDLIHAAREGRLVYQNDRPSVVCKDPPRVEDTDKADQGQTENKNCGNELNKHLAVPSSLKNVASLSDQSKLAAKNSLSDSMTEFYATTNNKSASNTVSSPQSVVIDVDASPHVVPQPENCIRIPIPTPFAVKQPLSNVTCCSSRPVGHLSPVRVSLEKADPSISKNMSKSCSNRKSYIFPSSKQKTKKNTSPIIDSLPVFQTQIQESVPPISPTILKITLPTSTTKIASIQYKHSMNSSKTDPLFTSLNKTLATDKDRNIPDIASPIDPPPTNDSPIFEKVIVPYSPYFNDLMSPISPSIEDLPHETTDHRPLKDVEGHVDDGFENTDECFAEHQKLSNNSDKTIMPSQKHISQSKVVAPQPTQYAKLAYKNRKDNVIVNLDPPSFLSSTSSKQTPKIPPMIAPTHTSRPYLNPAKLTQQKIISSMSISPKWFVSKQTPEQLLRIAGVSKSRIKTFDSKKKLLIDKKNSSNAFRSTLRKKLHTNMKTSTALHKNNPTVVKHSRFSSHKGPLPAPKKSLNPHSKNHVPLNQSSTNKPLASSHLNLSSLNLRGHSQLPGSKSITSSSFFPTIQNQASSRPPQTSLSLDQSYHSRSPAIPSLFPSNSQFLNQSLLTTPINPLYTTTGSYYQAVSRLPLNHSHFITSYQNIPTVKPRMNNSFFDPVSHYQAPFRLPSKPSTPTFSIEAPSSPIGPNIESMRLPVRQKPTQGRTWHTMGLATLSDLPISE